MTLGGYAACFGGTFLLVVVSGIASEIESCAELTVIPLIVAAFVTALMGVLDITGAMP